MKYLKTYESYNQEEIDKILDKISKSGVDSLTRIEKMKLDNSDNKSFSSKEELIGKIKSFMYEFGTVTTQDLMMDSSPVYKEIDQQIHLIERFYIDEVEVVVYGGYKYESEMSEYRVKWEDLSEELLDEILTELENYEE